MSSKFSPINIVKDFYKFYNSDMKILVVYPMMISIILSFFIKLNINLINLLLVALSIFIGFLLNLMLLSFNLKKDDVQPVEVMGKLWYLSDTLEEYHITISFDILITTILVILLLISSLGYQSILTFLPELVMELKIIFNFFITYLLILFFLLLFRVLKFGHILLKYYLKN